MKDHIERVNLPKITKAYTWTTSQESYTFQSQKVSVAGVLDDICSKHGATLQVYTSPNTFIGAFMRIALDPADGLPEYMERINSLSETQRTIAIKMSHARDWRTNIVEYSVQHYAQQDIVTKSHRDHYSRDMGALIKCNLITRIKKGIYLLNPEVVIPKNYKEAQVFWIQLSKTP